MHEMDKHGSFKNAKLAIFLLISNYSLIKSLTS